MCRNEKMAEFFKKEEIKTKTFKLKWFPSFIQWRNYQILLTSPLDLPLWNSDLPLSNNLKKFPQKIPWNPCYSPLPYKKIWKSTFKLFSWTKASWVTVVATPVWTRHSLCSKLIRFKMVWQTFKVLIYSAVHIKITKTPFM